MHHVALLRAVNVAGTGKLAMTDLRAMGTALGFADVRTFIASGNLLFGSGLDEATIKVLLEARLAVHAGKRVAVFVRTAAELAAIVAADPFPDAVGARHTVHFLDAAPPSDTIATLRDRQGERIALGTREIHVDYAANIRDTRLKFGTKFESTARNINSVRKLVGLLRQHAPTSLHGYR